MNRFFKFLTVFFVVFVVFSLAAEEAKNSSETGIANPDSSQTAEADVKSEEKNDGKVEKKDDGRGFVFGSYGRVQPATDLRGGSPKWVNIVSHGSRLEQEQGLPWWRRR